MLLLKTMKKVNYDIVQMWNKFLKRRKHNIMYPTDMHWYVSGQNKTNFLGIYSFSPSSHRELLGINLFKNARLYFCYRDKQKKKNHFLLTLMYKYSSITNMWEDFKQEFIFITWFFILPHPQTEKTIVKHQENCTSFQKFL